MVGTKLQLQLKGRSLDFVFPSLVVNRPCFVSDFIFSDPEENISQNFVRLEEICWLFYFVDWSGWRFRDIDVCLPPTHLYLPRVTFLVFNLFDWRPKFLNWLSRNMLTSSINWEQDEHLIFPCCWRKLKNKKQNSSLLTYHLFQLCVPYLQCLRLIRI